MTENISNTAAPKRGVPLWAQILVWIGLLGLLGLLAVSLLRARQGITQEGQAIPDFTLTLYKGYEYNGASQVHFADLRGKVVLINVWASWCKPCEQEAADLEAAWRKYQSTGKVVFLGVDYVDTEPEARSYLAKFEISYPNGPDLGTRISQMLNRNMGVPETYIIDQQGILRGVKIGPFASVAEIQAAIDPLLAGK